MWNGRQHREEQVHDEQHEQHRRRYQHDRQQLEDVTSFKCLESTLCEGHLLGRNAHQDRLSNDSDSQTKQDWGGGGGKKNPKKTITPASQAS